MTFVPCFLFIFLGAPYVERLRESTALSAALTGVTAAVVGVIANLAVYFAVHTLFSRTTTLSAGPVELVVPVWSSYVWPSFVVLAVAWCSCSCVSGRCCARWACAPCWDSVSPSCPDPDMARPDYGTGPGRHPIWGIRAGSPALGQS